MIDEAVLERLLHDEADTYVPPEHGPSDIEALAAESRTPRPQWGKATRILGVAAGLAGLVFVGTNVRNMAPEAQRAGGGTTAVADQVNRLHSGSDPDFTSGEDSGERDTSGGSVAQPKPDSAHVVKTGEVTVEVAPDRVATALREATRLATRLGGYVSASEGETAAERPSGYVTIRVPVTSFDNAVEEAGKLGELRSSTTRGEDVSDQITDTAARLRSLRATRGQLQTLLSRATTVGEVLSVQDKLNDVQTQIEKLQATQQSLADRTTYGTVKVEVVTEGTTAPDEKTGFAKAWDDAVDTFVGGFEGLVRASGPLAFAAILGAVLFVIGRRLYRVWVRSVI